MKQIRAFSLLSVTILILVHLASAQELYTLGTRVAVSPRADPLCGTKLGSVCADDCYTKIICTAPNKPPINTSTCPTNTPYCMGTSCTSVVDPDKKDTCAAAGAKYTCTVNGAFPDPVNCARYHVCDMTKTPPESEVFECPIDYKFNSFLSLCEQSLTRTFTTKPPTTTCGTLDCTTETNTIIVYKPNPAIYAFCFVDPDTNKRETFIFKCDEGENYVDNVGCEYICKAAGLTADAADCSFYHSCVAQSGGRFQHEKIKCPTGLYFSNGRCGTDNSCV